MNILTVAEREELGLPVDYAEERRIADKQALAAEQAKLQAVLDTLPCGCHACDEGVWPGHFACEVPTPKTLEAERAGEVVRHYDGTSWVWEV